MEIEIELVEQVMRGNRLEYLREFLMNHLHFKIMGSGLENK